MMKNLLFVSIEDLNDYVEPLGGHPQAVTPNVTRLAKSGMLFPNTYAPAPACSPSRTAVLYGRWPWETGIYTNKQVWHSFFRPDHDLSLIGCLNQAGFETHGSGKMFYGGISASEWTSYLKEPNDPGRRQSTLQRTFDIAAEMIDYGPSLIPDPLYDERNARYLLERMKPGSTGQVWSLGIYRPHLPFIAPRRFFDLYPETVLPAPALKRREFDPFSDLETEGLPGEPRRRIIKSAQFAKRLHQSGQYNAFLRAYLASVSYADFVLGLALDRLEECGLRENTNIVLWSDHGYHFGEKNVFHKFTLWERSLRTPMIFAGPDVSCGENPHPVSNVDLAKTVLNLMGVAPRPGWAGMDLLQMLRSESVVELPPVVSVYGWNKDSPPGKGNRREGTARPDTLLAWSVRTPEWRLVRYWNKGMELYDHRRDPNEHENLVPNGNCRKVPAALQGVVDRLLSHIPAVVAPANSPRKGRTLRRDGEDHLPHWSRSVYWAGDRASFS